jgi:large subunit ribosomal protein L5
MNYNKINDYIVKIPKNNPYNVPKIESIKVILSNNNLVDHPKLIIPLINTSQSITGQRPSIIKAKKSVASFKLRKASPVGLITTVRGEKLENYLKVLNSYILPRIATTKTYKNISFTTSKNSTLTLGIENLG